MWTRTSFHAVGSLLLLGVQSGRRHRYCLSFAQCGEKISVQATLKYRLNLCFVLSDPQ